MKLSAVFGASVAMALALRALGVEARSVGWPAPVRLRIAGLEQHPGQLVVLSEPLPRFSFSHPTIAAAPRGLVGAGYRFTVRRSPAAAPAGGVVVWDSGVVRSSSSLGIVYGGTAALLPFEAYSWSAAWLASDGQWSAEATASFEMGPITESDWTPAAWLVGSQLRAGFQLPAAAVRARAHVAAAGCHSLEVNGERPGPDLRGVCAWTVLQKRVLYQTHDITMLLRTGPNVVGLMSNMLDARDGLGTPLVRAILRVEMAGDAPPLVFRTAANNGSEPAGWMQAESWATMAGAGNPRWLRGWQMHMNWTAEEPGWSSPGSFRPARSWAPAASHPFAAASPAQQMPPATVVRRVAPVNATKLGWPASNGSHVSWLYAFPRNMVGMVELQPLPGAAAGSQVALVHGEWLEEGVDGAQKDWQRCELAACTGPDIVPVVSGGFQSVVHTLRPNNSAALSPLFAWHGFQYVRVVAAIGASFAGGLEAVTALEIHPNLTPTGRLVFAGDGVQGSVSEDAAAVLGGVHAMVLGSQLSNLAAYIPMSCPSTEKQGWLGDALFASEESMYNFDLEAIYTSWLASIEDDQGVSGDVPFVVPGRAAAGHASCNDIAWTSAYPQIASFVGAYYGSARPADRHWPSLTRYADNLIGRAGSDSVATCDQFLDWVTAGVCDTGMCPVMFSAECESSRCPVGEEMAGFSYVLGLRAMASMAGHLGRGDPAGRYATAAAAATRGFHARFWNESSRSYGSDWSGQQMLSIPAMTIDAMPSPDVQARVVELMRADLHNRSGHHLQVGAVSSKSYLNELSRHGLHAEALRVATQRTEPGWGWWLTMGATTCWEKWPGDTSRNHIFMCGGYGEWLWKYVVGLRLGSPGFATVVIEPNIDGFYGPAHASGNFTSPRGSVFVAWGRADTNGSISVRAALPPGVASATVRVPAPFGVPTPASPEVVCATGSELGAKQVAINSFNQLTGYPKVVHLECSGGGRVGSIDYASFGVPSANASADCGRWSGADQVCHANSSFAVVERLCLNQTRCSIAVNTSVFGGDPCPFHIKTLAIRATCVGGMARARPSTFTVSEGGKLVWDGAKVVAGVDGVISAHAAANAVEFQLLGGGDYSFETSAG